MEATSERERQRGAEPDTVTNELSEFRYKLSGIGYSLIWMRLSV